MKALQLILIIILAGGLLLTGCGQKTEKAEPKEQIDQTEQAGQSGEAVGNEQGEEAEEGRTEEFVSGVKELVDGLKQGAEAGKTNWAKAEELYGEKVQAVVQARDAEAKGQVDEQLTAAAAAGKEGSLSGTVVAQIYDKLLQKVAFLSIRHDFKEANEMFDDKEFAKGEMEEAREYYDGILKGMVEKRDKAYETQLVGVIDGGFAQMDQAIEQGDNLAFNLGKQVIDKTLMKAFYLAAGAEKGYAYKIEKAVSEDGDEDPKVEQAEGWAFFQSLKSYLEGHDKESADYIESQFDLSNDAKNIKGDMINAAFVRGFAAIAKDEYGESFENWGKDKSVITALEGALFIDLLSTDLPEALGGQDKADALLSNAQKLLDEVKAGNKEQAETLYKLIEADLNILSSYGK